MKVKVIVNAVEDRETKKLYQAGDIFELPEDRALAAIGHGYVEEVKDDGHDTKKSRKAVATDHN